MRSEALLQAAYHPDRITTPLARIAKGGPFRRIGWPEAIDRLTRALQEADPASVLLATSPLRGRIADVTKTFASGYGASLMGFDTLDNTVLRAAMKRVYNQDALPDFDIANTGFLLSFGSDFLGTWMDPTHFMRGYGEFRQGEGRERGRLVQVDSRYSLTAAAADRWIVVTPGSEGLLAMAMMHTIVRESLAHPDAGDAIEAMTEGRGINGLGRYNPGTLSPRIGMPVRDIQQLARDFASGQYGQPLAIGGGSAAAHTNGVFNLTAIYALNYLVGAVGRPGGIILNPATLQSRVDAAPLSEWKAALERMRQGATKIVLARDANFVYGLPGSLEAAEALDNVETIVSFSSFLDETTARADLILPGHTPLEEWGTDVPNPGPGYPTVGFQQPVINRFRDTVAFGDVLLRTAKDLNLGNELPWATMRDAVREGARELHASQRGSVVKNTFEEFWKRALERGGWWDMTTTVPATDLPTPPALPVSPVAPRIPGNPGLYPLSLVPFEGHGIGAGQFAHLPWAQAVPDPLTTVAWTTWVELNPNTAKSLDLKQDDVVTIESAAGATMRAPVYVNPATPPQVAAIPLGQGHRQFTSYAAGRGANVLDIISPDEDDDTGALAWAATRVRLVKSNVRQGLTKLEGLQEVRQLPGEPVILVQREGRA